MILVSAEIELGQLVDIFGHQLDDGQAGDFALQLVMEDKHRANRLMKHLEYFIDCKENGIL